MGTIAMICIFVGFGIWFFSAAVWAKGQFLPLIFIAAMIVSAITPPGLWGVLLMLLGFILLMFS